jgi:hypothetical protein
MEPSGAETLARGDHDAETNGVAQPPRSPISGTEPASLDCVLQPSTIDRRQGNDQELGPGLKEHRGWRRLIRNFTPSYVRPTAFPNGSML